MISEVMAVVCATQESSPCRKRAASLERFRTVERSLNLFFFHINIAVTKQYGQKLLELPLTPRSINREPAMPIESHSIYVEKVSTCEGNEAEA